MKQDQIERIRDSFAHVLRAGDTAAEAFYGRLFEIAPDTRAMFNDDLAEQGRLLIAALAQIVTGLSHFQDVRPSLEALARRHVGYGVRLEHYDVVGAALLHMIDRVGGSAHDAATIEAWRTAYALVARTMIDASCYDDRRSAAGPPSDCGRSGNAPQAGHDRAAFSWPDRIPADPGRR